MWCASHELMALVFVPPPVQMLVPPDHVSRSPNDTYYVTKDTVLRCHTSAHQGEMLRKGQRAFLVTGEPHAQSSFSIFCWVFDTSANMLGTPSSKLHQPVIPPVMRGCHHASHVAPHALLPPAQFCMLTPPAFPACPAQATCTAVTPSTPPTTLCSTRWRGSGCSAKRWEGGCGVPLGVRGMRGRDEGEGHRSESKE
jgi:hypothetical protein